MKYREIEQAEELKILAILIVECLPVLSTLVVEAWLDKQNKLQDTKKVEKIKPAGPGKFIE